MLDEGKWQKYTCMREDPNLSQFLPDTFLFREDKLWSMLEKYHTVILKPLYGLQGIGIIVIHSIQGKYEIIVEKQRQIIEGKKDTLLHLQKIMRNRPYIVQQFIRLDRVKNRLFDVRIMVQRGNNDQWEVTGRLAKVSYKGYRVTNPEELVMPVERVLQESTSLKTSDFSSIIQTMDRLALYTAEVLSRHYNNLNIIGFDFGLDESGKVWIIEANFSPAIYWFKQLPDRKMYHKIIHTQRNYLQTQRNPKPLNRSSIKTSEDEVYYAYYYY